MPGEIIAAAFGCFNPKVVAMAVTGGWQITDRDTVLEARQRGATQMLQRVLGPNPDGLERVTELLTRGAAAAPWAGHPVFSGLMSLGYPDDPMAAMWRAADLLREHRGDSHVITWAVGGVDAVDILLLTEQGGGCQRAHTRRRGAGSQPTWTLDSNDCSNAALVCV